MDRAGIDRACVSAPTHLLQDFPRRATRSCEQVAARRPSGHFAVINLADWEHDLAVCVGTSARGLRLYPHYHNSPLGDARGNELMAAAIERDLVISIPIRQIDQRQRHWLLEVPDVALEELTALVRRHPTAKLVFLEGIGFTGSPLGQTERAAELRHRHLAAERGDGEDRVLLDHLGAGGWCSTRGCPSIIPNRRSGQCCGPRRRRSRRSSGECAAAAGDGRLRARATYNYALPHLIRCAMSTTGGGCWHVALGTPRGRGCAVLNQHG